MIEKNRYCTGKHSKPGVLAENKDLLVTFRSKIGPSENSASKLNGPLLELRKDQKKSNRIYFQEIARKPNLKMLPPLNSFPSCNFQSKNLEFNRVGLHSDSAVFRANKKETLEAVNATSQEFFKHDHEASKEKSGLIKGFYVDTQAAAAKKYCTEPCFDNEEEKTPTFRNEKGKDRSLGFKEFCEKNDFDKNGAKNTGLSPLESFKSPREKSQIKVGNNLQFPCLSTAKKKRNVRYRLDKVLESEREMFSDSKQSLIGSSISTSVFSNASAQEIMLKKLSSRDIINNITSRKDSPIKTERDHPKIRVRKTGLPADVFTYRPGK